MLGRLEAVVGVAAGSMLSGVVVLVVLAGLGVFGTTSNLGSGEAAGAASLYGSGDDGGASDDYGSVDDGEYGYGDSSEASSADYAIERAWRDGVSVGYVDFGTDTPLDAGGQVPLAPIWAFVSGFDDDGTPQMIEGHRTILHVLPGDAGYSDLWVVEFVVVPEGYDSESIHSLADLEASGLEVVPSEMLVNCPMVPEGATVESGQPVHATWYREETAHYFDMGLSTTTPGDAYVFVASLNDAGEPTELVGQPVLSGELDGDFWRLHYVVVGGEFGANSIRSLAELEASGLAVTSTEALLNWPVVEASSTP
ncbi:MAG: hypothetical protein HOH95_10310 [Dehalococcoidia bacterium]|nr:hypothetical protein [Dehalococcoidia bacterium]